MDSKPKLYADLRVKTGTYEKDGKPKNRYATIGALFATPHKSNMYIQIDTLPRDIGAWDGRIYVNPREEVKTTSDITGRDMSEPVNLSDVPF
jgi:hypothetical protein